MPRQQADQQPTVVPASPRRKIADPAGVDLYGPRSGSKPALDLTEVTDLLKGNPSLAKALKLDI